MRARQVAAALGLAGLILVTTVLLTDTGDGPHRVVATASARLSAPRLPGSLSPIDTVPFAGATRASLRVVDQISRRPLCEVAVIRNETPTGDDLLRTDSCGFVTIPRTWLQSGVTLEFLLPPTLGARRLQRVLKDQEADQIESKGHHEIALPVFAHLELSLGGAPLEAAKAELIPCPELPLERPMTVETVEALKSLREKIPADYLTELRKRGWVPDHISLQTARFAGDGTASFHVPWSGPVVICAYGPRRSPVHERAELQSGETTRVELRLGEKPVVSGSVVHADGTPAAGVKVTVGCRAWFSGGSVPPRGSREAGNPAFIYLGRRGSEDMEVHAILSCRTNARGEYATPMPYTATVVAYVFLPGFERALARRVADTNDQPVKDLVITLHRVTSSAYMKVTAKNGTRGERWGFRCLQYSPPDMDQLQLPDLVTDKEGRLDVTWLTPGATYYFMAAGDEPFQFGSFVCKRGGVVEVTCDDP